MLTPYHNMKLKHKIALVCILLIAVSSLGSALLLHSYVANQIRETADVNSTDMMIQVSNFFDEKLKSIIRRAFALQVNDSFQKQLADFLLNDEKYRYAMALSQFSESFSEIRSTETYISSIYMDTPKGDFFDLARIKRRDFNFKASRLYRQLSGVSAKSVFWGVSRRDEIYADAKTVVPLVVRFTVEGYNGDVFLVVNLDEQMILDYLTKIYSGPGNWILLLDHKGRTVVSGHEAITGMFIRDRQIVKQIATGSHGSIKRNYGKENYIINFQEMNVAPWKIVNIQSERILLKKVNAFGAFLLVLTIASIVICLVFTLVLSNSITHPLERLENAIIKVTRRDFDVKFNYQYYDEVGKLGASFNFMVEEIRELIRKLNQSITRLQEEKEKVKAEQLLKRQAELKALQSQINPHFLYNTLDSIHWMADQIDADDISRMTMALGSLFRTGLNKGDDIISIPNELENVKSYLTIQKMRYGERFCYQIDVDQQLLPLMTIKLILQPLVENAIYHGIKEQAELGLITITGRLRENGQVVEFIIRDTGAGIQPLALELIERRLAEGTSSDCNGYGIYNVNERIRLYFGERYGLKFRSELGQGTEVKLVIPAIRQEELGKYVQNHGSG